MKRLVLWVLLAVHLPTQAGTCRDAPLSASFLQPLSSNLQRPPEQWQRLLKEIAELGIDTLYLQWSVYGDLDLTRAEGLAFLNQWMGWAQSSGLRIHMGLVADADYGGKIAQPLPALEEYLQELRDRTLAAAQRLHAAVSDHPAFAGWYLSEEIDDRNWNEPWQIDLLSQHLHVLNERLTELDSELPISISTYVSEAESPEQFASLWRALWMAAPRLRVLLQDGAGVGSVAPDKFAEYAQRFSEVAGKDTRDWGVILEIFEQQSGPPLDEEPFSARAASIERIQQQLAVVAKLRPPSTEIVAFSVPEYLLDPARPGQNDLLRDYQKLYCR